MEYQDSMKPSPDPAQSSKLTNWAKEPSIQQLKGDLEAARPAHDAWIKEIQKWNDLMKVSGKAAPVRIKGKSAVQPKLVRRQAEWRYSALTEPFLGTNKIYQVSPVTWEDQDAATQNELVLNWQFRTKLNRIKFVDDYVRSVVDDGTGVVQLGWDRQVVKVKQTVPVFQMFPIENQEQMEQLQQALELKGSNPRGYDEGTDDAIKEAVNYFEETGEATHAIQNGEQEVEIEKALVNKPTATLLNPENFVIDPSCQGDIEKATFAVVSFETSQSELKKLPGRYKNLNLVDWESASPISDPNHATTTPSDFQIKDAMRKRVVAYEYWGFHDIHDDGVLKPIVATWIGSVLIRMEENPFPDEKLPFVVVPYMPRKRELFGEADAELLGDNQAILGAVMRGMIDSLGRTANGQRGIAKGMLDGINKRKWENGDDYEYNPNTNPSQQIIEHKFPELPQSAIVMSQIMNQEAESLTGVKAFSGGVSGDSYGDVAAGIRGVLDAASKREMAILRRLAKGITEIGTKIIAMNSAFLSEQEVIRVTNDQFVEVKREDLAGNFDLEVDISTAEVDNQKADDLGFMVQTVGPKVDQRITLNLMARIADLKRMPELAHELRNYQPQPDPVQEQLQQLEIEKARLENGVLQAEIELKQAQARKAMSEADGKDLDYLEQESGTTHARDMEKNRAQSQGNQNLQVTKALTQPRKEGETPPNLPAAIGFNALTSGDNPVTNVGVRDQLAQQDPTYSLGSGKFQPSQDPALNPAINI